MADSIPRGKLSRTLSSGKIAVKMGTNQLGQYMKRPFLSEEKHALSKRKTDEKNAKILFNGLSMLRGTALKIAQLLSLEQDIFSMEIRKELEKSYHQVPPINQSLVRKMITNNLGKAPEMVFKTFDTKAFAAASLGQVHRAVSFDDEVLAVKIQYPDIAKTISNDIGLLKTVLRPMKRYDVIKDALEEVRVVLLDETDYEKEAANIQFFYGHFKNKDIKIPRVYPKLSTKNVLSMSYMDGMMLNDWLDTEPDIEDKNKVAQALNNIFVSGFYELKQIHADPNPGNFLVTEDLTISLLDFGCVRSFSDEFVDLYQTMVQMGGTRDTDAYIALLTRLKFITPELDRQIRDDMVQVFFELGEWYGQLFYEPEFDFASTADFLEEGKKLGHKMSRFLRHIDGINPEFIFLDRTRYGLFRLFEKMKVKIKLRNQYEYCDR